MRHQYNDESKVNAIETYGFSKTFKTTHDSQRISVLSWNVMHKDFVDVSVNRKAMYASLDDLTWNQRLPKIKKKLSSSNADIVCLQEIDKHSFTDDIGHYFKQKHNYSFKLNQHKKIKVDFSLAIMYKSSKFKCEYEDYRQRAIILLLTNTLDKAKCSTCIHSTNLCIHHSFFLATVHLQSQGKSFGKDDGNNHESTRVNQIKSVIKRINLCIRNMKLSHSTAHGIRIIIVGDFNSFHEYDTAQMLLNNNNSEFHHKYQFKDAYHEKLILENERYGILACNDCNLRIKRFPTYAALGNIMSIDFMFYTHNNMELKGITNTIPDNIRKEVRWNEMVSKRIDEWLQNDRKTNCFEQYMFADYRNILQLPNQQIPSDHFPIGCIFQFHTAGNEQCLDCVNQPTIKSKKKQNKSCNSQRYNKNYNTWAFHEINSF
eukprot:663398_1